MTDIAVIGLGLMGAALARTIRGAGHALTVWNRSPARAQPFADAGVPVAADLASAITASPVVLICIDNYAATKAMLQPHLRRLAGRTVIQLSTGTSREARDAERWVEAQGARYIDGAILGAPTLIGTGDAIIPLSGDPAAHEAAAGLVACLGDVRYLGANVGAAAALDLAWLCTSYGQFIAIAQAALICEAEGVGLDAYGALFAKGSLIQRYSAVIHTGDFGQRTATLDVWAKALDRVRMQAADAGVNSEFPDLLAAVLQQARDAGYGDDNVISIVKVLRGAR